MLNVYFDSPPRNFIVICRAKTDKLIKQHIKVIAATVKYFFMFSIVILGKFYVYNYKHTSNINQTSCQKAGEELHTWRSIYVFHSPLNLKFPQNKYKFITKRIVV